MYIDDKVKNEITRLKSDADTFDSLALYLYDRLENYTPTDEEEIRERELSYLKSLVSNPFTDTLINKLEVVG